MLDLREAVRGLVISDDQLILVQWTFPSGVTAWGVPGGGLEPGEDLFDGLRRELREELGLNDVTIGPALWERTHLIKMLNGQDGQHEVVYLIEVAEPFDIQPEIGWDALHDEMVTDIRWWSLDEVRASAERMVPSELADIIDDLRRSGMPAQPLTIVTREIDGATDGGIDDE